MKTEPEFRNELTALINRHSRENGSDTPDFILGEFVADVLYAFDQTVKRRERWYGRRCGNGQALKKTHPRRKNAAELLRG